MAAASANLSGCARPGRKGSSATCVVTQANEVPIIRPPMLAAKLATVRRRCTASAAEESATTSRARATPRNYGRYGHPDASANPTPWPRQGRRTPTELIQAPAPGAMRARQTPATSPVASSFARNHKPGS